MIRILIAAGVPRRREGGVAGVVSSYAREFEALGHQVTCVFAEDLPPVPSRRGRYFELRWAARLSAHIWKNRQKFDVVNLHAPTGVCYGLRRRWFSSTLSPPYIMTLHGLEENRVYAMKREAHKGRAWDFSWKNRAWHRIYHQPRFNWSIRTADGAHCFSRDVWTTLRLKYNLDDERVAYIPNGVDERFFLARNYRPNGALRMLFPGTWLDQRGIFYLRDVLPRIFHKHPALRFTFAGPAVEPEVILRFFGNETSHNIDIVPTVPWEQMPPFYAEHDILVFPSLVEGQPGVLLEAMASGMPVITTETCGMPDVVEDGSSGLLIPPADAVGLEAAILLLAESPELRERLGRAAQERMRRQTWRDSAQRLVRFFEARISAQSKGKS